MRQTGLGAEERPRDRREGGDDDDRFHEVCRDPVGETLHRSLGALRLRDHVNDARKQRVRAYALGADDEGAFSVNGSASDAITGLLAHRERLPGNHGLVHVGLPFHADAVHRDLFARPHAQPISDLDLVERHFDFAAVGGNAQRGVRRKGEELPNRLARLSQRAKLKHLAKHN